MRDAVQHELCYTEITEEYNFILIVFEKYNTQVLRLINTLILQFCCPSCLPSGFGNWCRLLSPGSNFIKDKAVQAMTREADFVLHAFVCMDWTQQMN